MNIKNLIVSLFLGLLVFGIGIGLGILYQTQQGVVPQSITQPKNNVQVMPEVIKMLSSKVIPSIAAQGTVTKIDGRNITLNYQTDSITIGIRNDAIIYSIVFNTSPAKTGSINNGASSSKQIDFKALKIGDNISVNFRVLPSGQIEGFSIIVLPIPSSSTAKPVSSK